MTSKTTSISTTEPLAAAESVVRQKLYFPQMTPPARKGVLYTKVWKAPFVNGVTDEWVNRVAGYWERIEKKFGVIWSRPVITYDEETATIMTAATILAIIPGKRYSVKDRH